MTIFQHAVSATPRLVLAAAARELLCLELQQDVPLGHRQSLALPHNAQFAAISRARRRVYVACSNGGIHSAGDRHELVEVALDAAHEMSMLRSIPLPHRPIHVAVDDARSRVYVVFNQPAGCVCLAQSDRYDDSALAVESAASGFEVAGWFPHHVLPLPDSDVLLLSARGEPMDGGTERSGSLRLLKTEQGRLQCIQSIAPDTDFGFSPRNCALHPRLPVVYAVLERQNMLMAFGCQGHRLDSSPLFSVATFAEHTPQNDAHQFAGDLCLSRSGRFAYVLNRSRDPAGENSVCAFALDAVSGAPRLAATTRLPGQHPRSVAIDPASEWLAVSMLEPRRARTDEKQVLEPSGLCLLAVQDDRMQLVQHMALGPHNAPVAWADFLAPPAR